MNKFSPAEDAEIFMTAAAFVASLDRHEMANFMKEVYLNSPNCEILAEMEVAIDTVWADIEEEMEKNNE